MDQAQFTIPETPELSTNEQLVRDVDAIFETIEVPVPPEVEAAPFSRFKGLEAEIEAMRETVTEVHLPRWIK